MKKNRILALTGAACLSVALLAGCGNNGNNNTNPSANPSNDGEGGTTSTLSGKIATGGSTSMQKLMGMLQEDFMAKNAGVTMTGAGATWPYGNDPADSNIRIAPSLPPLEELDAAMDVFTCCVKLAALEQLVEG